MKLALQGVSLSEFVYIALLCSRLKIQQAKTTAISSAGKRAIATVSNNVARQPANMPTNTNSAPITFMTATKVVFIDAPARPAIHSLQALLLRDRAFGCLPSSGRLGAYGLMPGQLDLVPDHQRGGCEPE